MITRTSREKPWALALIFLCTLLLNIVLVCCEETNDGKESSKTEETGGIKLDCDDKELSCKTDKQSLEAINELHHMIDDDQDGNVNQQESKGFLKEELQYSGGSDRVAIFHNNDSLISVDDLWKAWVKSEVYNWTVDEVIHWLEHHVHYPQYSATFRANKIDGHSLPRIAITKGTTLKSELGIKNGIHRQKISVQAMDLVLFGPPKDGHNVLKDIALILSTFVVVGVSWFAYSQNKRSKSQLERMLHEMESLQKADDALKDVQTKLNEAEELQQHVHQEKTQLEMKFQDEIAHAKKEAERLKVAREGSIEEISRLKLAEEELVQVRQALKRAEKELERSQWYTPTALRSWLQLTHEIELDYFNIKKAAADEQLRRARDECEKMSRKRSGFFGSLRVATSSTMDEMDHQIEEARSALEEVKLFSDERLQRWHNVEQICGFAITSNPGKEKLVQILQIGGPKIIPVDIGFRNVDDGELDEDIPPGYPGTVSRGQDLSSTCKASTASTNNFQSRKLSATITYGKQKHSPKTDRIFMTHGVTNGMVRPPPYPASRYGKRLPRRWSESCMVTQTISCQPNTTISSRNRKQLIRRWSETNMKVQTGYSIPGTSTPLRPHNLPNALMNSMGQYGSSSSLPRSRTPKSGQNRYSDESNNGEELSNGVESNKTDTSLPDKPVFSLESSPLAETNESGSQQQLGPPSYQSMKNSKSMQVIGSNKHYSDTIGGLGYIQNHNQSIRQAVPLSQRSHSDANLEKLNNSTVYSTSQSLEEKTSKSKDKKKTIFKFFHKKNKS